MAREYSLHLCSLAAQPPHHTFSPLLCLLDFLYLLSIQSVPHSSTLLQLFFKPSPFVFNTLRTLRQKQRGHGVPFPNFTPSRGSTMTLKSPSSDFTPERCQHRTRTGRQCRSVVANASSSFCAAHAASEPADSQDFEVALTERACRFQNAQGVNHSLGALYTLLAQGRISPRRASVLAHISGLLLRSLTAIDNDPYPKAGRPGYDPYAERLAQTHLDHDDEEEEAETETPAAASAAAGEQRVAPGKDPLPATAAEFAATVLNRRKPN